MAVYVHNVELFLPTEAALSLLTLTRFQICNGCPISVAGEPPDPVIQFQLYENAIEITDATVFADLGVVAAPAPIDLNAEAAPDYCLGHIEGPDVQPDGLPTLIIDQHEFDPAPFAMTLSGVAIVADLGAGDVIIGVAAFAAPQPLLTGDVLKVSGLLKLHPHVPADDV